MPRIYADAEQIKQVLLNLAINGLQAMAQVHANGIDKTLTFRTLESDGNCVLEVEDTGPGIEPKNLSKVFDPFFTTKDKGIGLGLSIAHKIVTQHLGKIVANNTDRGTLFSVHLEKSTS